MFDMEQVGRKSNRVTKFIVERENIGATNTDTNVQFAARHFTVGRNNTVKPFSFYKVSNLSNTESIEVLMRSETGLEKVALSEKMLERIAQYIRDESSGPLQDFDCASFAHFVAGVPYELTQFHADKWNIHPLSDESVLKVGDIAMIVRTDTPGSFQNTDKITHFAIYLGSGLYISKFGGSGKLIVANIKEMEKGFDGNYAYHITLRK